MSKTCYIDKSRPHCPMLHLELDGRIYGFSAKGFPEESHEWLAEQFETQMREVHDRAVASTKENLQKQFRELLGLAGEKR